MLGQIILQNGQFEDSEEEIPLVLEAFYPEEHPAVSASDLPEHAATQAIHHRTPVRQSKLTEQLGSGSH